MGKFVNPFTDVGFKVIFGSELSKDLLIAFLNELLLGEHEIEDLSFLDKEDWADNIHNRGIVYDIFCRCRTVGTAISWIVRFITSAAGSAARGSGRRSVKSGKRGGRPRMASVTSYRTCTVSF